MKNLENVQGDERDVILFSICYGPDLRGRVSMNFGPMNRDGGERRLNVAVTRARREVLVFSTLTADRIDLSRTRAKGVADLKHFLEYAEHGPAVLGAESSLDPDADFDSPFEEAVYDALTARGRTLHKQVGCARYRIDLAVVDPEAPGRYLLGVECDGANYHRAKTARDRDKLREGVLRDLGWTLHRVWSTDWRADPEREMEKIEEALRQAEQNRDKESEEPLVREPAVPPAPPAAPVESEILAASEPERREPTLQRSIGEIPLAEISGVIILLLETNLSAPRDEIARGTARLLGFARVGKNIAARIDQAIELLVRQGEVGTAEGMVTLVNPRS